MLPSARYDAVADFYEAFAPDVYDDPPMRALLQLIGEVSGHRLLDLACGHGRLTRELARRGSHVVGVDLSAALLDMARARETKRPLHVTYVHADAASPATLVGEHVDGVTCSFGLSDIDDVDGAIATVARVLRADGFFAFSIVHPCFPGWEATHAPPSWQPGRGYYEQGWWRGAGPARNLRPKVGATHRTLSTYLNTLVRHGLAIEQVAEPLPPLDWLERAPAGGPVPLYLVVRCRRRE